MQILANYCSIHKRFKSVLNSAYYKEKIALL